MMLRYSSLALLPGLVLLTGALGAADGQTDTRPLRPEKPTRVDLHSDPLPPGAIARLGTSRLRHAGDVSWVCFASGGKSLLSAGQDGLVRVWETASGKELHRFPWAHCLPACGDKTLVTMTEDFAVRVWDIGTGVERYCFKAKPLPRTVDSRFSVPNVAITPDGRTLCSWRTEGGQRVIRVWDLAAGKEQPSTAFPAANLSGARMNTVALSPDGKFLAGADDRNSTVHVWQTATGKLFRKLENIASCHLLTFSPDSKTLAVEVPSSLFSLWDVTTGKKLPAAADAPGLWYWSVAFAPDGKTVAAPGQNKGAPGYHVQWWTTATGKKLYRHMCSGDSVPFLTFSSDGKFLAAAASGHEVHIWETATGKEVSRFLVQRMSFNQFCWLAFSADSRTLAVAASSKQVHLFELPAAKEIRMQAGSRYPPTTLAVSADGKTLAALAQDQTTQLWDAATGKELHHFPALTPPTDANNSSIPSALVFLPNLKTPFVCWNGKDVVLQDVARKEKPRHFRGNRWCSSYAFFLGGKRLVMADSAGTIHVWDTATAKEVRRFPWPHGVGPDGGPPFLQLRVAASRNGVAVAAVGHIPVRNGESLRLGLRLWETASGQELFTSLFREWHPGSPRAPVVAPYPDAISGLAFSQDGAALALANGETIRLWDAARGKELRRFGGTGVKAETAAFCPDGRLLAALSEDGTLHLWEVATGTALPPVGGRHLPITCFLFSPNGRVLFTGCKDTTILAWDVAYLRERGHAKRLAAGELEALWRDLADKDAGRAYRALL